MPLGKSIRSVLFENVAATEVTIEVEMTMNRSVDGGEFMQSLDVPEPRHRSFSSSERLMRVFGSIVEPTTALLIGIILGVPGGLDKHILSHAQLRWRNL